jgi:hypothetical protein
VTARRWGRGIVVLEALAVRPGDVLGAERLAGALWADGVPATWPVVQGCGRLRKAIGAEAIGRRRRVTGSTSPPMTSTPDASSV